MRKRIIPTTNHCCSCVSCQHILPRDYCVFITENTSPKHLVDLRFKTRQFYGDMKVKFKRRNFVEANAVKIIGNEMITRLVISFSIA